MDFDELTKVLRSRSKERLPFVVYHKPGSEVVRAWMPAQARFGSAGEMSEPGFVFAPFDPRDQSVLFPLASSRIVEIPFSRLRHSDQNSNDRKTTTGSQKPQNKGDLGRSSHIELVQETIEFIRSEKASKVVISRCEEIGTGDLGPLGVFVALSHRYEEAFTYLWYHPEVGMWSGASPEVLLKMEGEAFQTMSLAGTRLYQGNEEVNWEAKELEEQQLVTGLIQQELKEYLTHVGRPYDHRAGHLVHLRTDLRGEVQRGSHPLTIIKKLHPTAAVCGIPRKAALEFILKHEAYPRAYYTGYLGELLGPDQKRSHLFVNLRCMQLLQEQKKAWVYVGGGITSASDAEKEWEETVAKSKTMKQVFS
jgi:isochorismate synthase